MADGLWPRMQAEPSQDGWAGDAGGNGALTIFSTWRDTSGWKGQGDHSVDVGVLPESNE